MRPAIAPIVRILCIVAALAIVATGLAATPAIPTDDAAIVHALGRLTFGATVRDVARVKEINLARWIDQQLNPSAIADGALQARLARFETLDLPSSVIAREYERPVRMERLQQRKAQSPTETSATDTAPRQPPTEAQMKARLVIGELSEAKILRAVYSERQLEEVLVDFWFNHFNVFAGKGQTRVYLGEYERTAIRPHVLGSFRELLGATAKSPAMLFYLDNWLSSAAADATTLTPARMPGRRPLDNMAVARPPQRMRGLNENYGRELLELHTLGVDGGYTQTDIVNVARAFTGWTIRRRAARFGGQVPVGTRRNNGADSDEGGEFQFVPAMHDAGEKVVLGQTIKAGGGQQDGERVLDILAAHPSTARFIATKLAQRFVSDQPPQALIDRAAARFRETHGNLREVTRTIITSPEFFATDARNVKVKTPLEFVASALRATDADIQNAMPLGRVLRDLGMPVYLCQPPTGYDQTADTWVSSGALVNRMNFAVDLTSGRVRGTSIASSESDSIAARELATRTLLFGRVSESTLATMAKATTPSQTLALAIGSPEFQRR